MIDDDPRYQITAEGLAELQRELAELEGAGRQEIAARIKTAREWGDLKENGEYHAAKEAQAHLETRILRVRDRIVRAAVVESGAGATTVSLGSTVAVRDEATGKESTYTFVSAAEAAPADGRLAINSPVGRALTGARAGETRELQTPSGARRLTVVSLS